MSVCDLSSELLAFPGKQVLVSISIHFNLRATGVINSQTYFADHLHEEDGLRWDF